MPREDAGDWIIFKLILESSDDLRPDYIPDLYNYITIVILKFTITSRPMADSWRHAMA